MFCGIEFNKLSPMMQQYGLVKIEHEDCIVFYRLGDFYEMFFEDAIEASSILELTLTKRDCGKDNEPAPMCGVPFHACDYYIAKLINAGKKVAIVEQLSDPNLKQKPSDLVERGVIRIVTPGTVVETECLNQDKNNYIVSLSSNKKAIGVCWADISTGFIEVGEFEGTNQIALVDNLLSNLKPSEIVANQTTISLEEKLIVAKNGDLPKFTILPETSFSQSNATKNIKNQFKVNSISALGLDQKPYALSAAGGLISYLSETHKQSLYNITNLYVYYDKDYLQLDYNARKNLELVESMVTHKKQGSLLWLLDETKNCMGARKLRNFIDNPLSNSKKINDRLDAVEELVGDIETRINATEHLANFSDIERITAKIATKTVTPKDCYLLGQSLKVIPLLKTAISGVKSQDLTKCLNNLFDFNELTEVLTKAFSVEAPVNYKDGGFILAGFNEELDKLRSIAKTAYDWVSNFEKTEKERTGIKNLKVSYNKVFGYYIEVTKSQLHLVPPEYQLRQTTLGGEKFITNELKEAERMILTGSHDALVLELKLYEEIKEILYNNIEKLLKTADAIATIDAICSLASVSAKNGYVKPEINEYVDKIEIIGGRHPVVEKMLTNANFVANDALIDNGENNILIITGPNMGGKSTFMRQVALITLMAHIGCLVPARSAKISLTDRIFTRIGASDELAFGNSTFMVEMSEVSNIIRNATDKSLVILDEVGRGTSTFDGLSIAWAIIEYIATKIKCKTLFATHYHELIALENKMVGVKNYRVLVKELNDSIIFLHKIARGSANRSFGIEVASLAGLPNELIDRSKQILRAQEGAQSQAQIATPEEAMKPEINPNAVEVINILKEMDLDTISPLMAFGTLQNLVDKVKKS